MHGVSKQVQTCIIIFTILRNSGIAGTDDVLLLMDTYAQTVIYVTVYTYTTTLIKTNAELCISLFLPRSSTHHCVRCSSLFSVNSFFNFRHSTQRLRPNRTSWSSSFQFWCLRFCLLPTKKTENKMVIITAVVIVYIHYSIPLPLYSVIGLSPVCAKYV